MSDQHEFKPDWVLDPVSAFAVALSLALNGVPGWNGATDEQLDEVARSVIKGCDPAWMRDVLRSRRDELPLGELRSSYNAACDRLDVLDSVLDTEARRERSA